MPIVEVPLCYSIVAVAKNKRKEETYVVSETTPVEVAAVSAKDAPVAVKAVVEGSKVSYRMHDGRLWEPVRLCDPKLDAQDAARLPFETNPFVAADSPLRTAPDKVKPTVDLALKSVSKNNRAEGLADAQRRANDVILIDGVIHQSSPGPVLVVTADARGRAAKMTVEHLADQIPLVYRCDEWDMAAETANSMFGNVSLPAQRPEILAPEALTLDSRSHSVVAAGRHLYSTGLEKFTSGSLTTAFMYAWLDYRKDDFDPSVPSPALEQLISTAAAEFAQVRNGTEMKLIAERMTARLEHEPAPGMDAPRRM